MNYTLIVRPEWPALVIMQRFCCDVHVQAVDAEIGSRGMYRLPAVVMDRHKIVEYNKHFGSRQVLRAPI
jgi:hypothetical protein